MNEKNMQSGVALNVSTLVVIFVIILSVVLVACSKSSQVFSIVAPVLGVVALCLATLTSLQYNNALVPLGWVEKISILVATVLLFVRLAVNQKAKVPLNYTAMAMLVVAFGISIATLTMHSSSDRQDTIASKSNDQWPLGEQQPQRDIVQAFDTEPSTSIKKLRFEYPDQAKGQKIEHPDDMQKTKLSIPGQSGLRFEFRDVVHPSVQKHPDDENKSKLRIPESYKNNARRQFWK